MKLYTKSGDTGKTAILGGTKVNKDNLRIEAYGTIDELNSVLGSTHIHVHSKLKPNIILIQNLLFELGTELASPKILNRLTEDDIKMIENLIDESEKQLEPLSNFVLPGGSEGSSWLHFSRTVCRRAERRVVTLSNDVEISPIIVPFLNRLSDLFFSYSRLNNKLEGVTDVNWNARTN